MRVLILFSALFVSQILFSQNRTNDNIESSENWFILNWDIAFPTNSDFLSGTSFTGGRMEYRHLFTPNLAAGVSIGWNSFEDQLGQQLFETGNGSTAVFTDLIRQVYNVPFSLNGYYYFEGTEKLKPYVGLGLGAQYSEQEAFFNIYVIDDFNWGFLMRPEAGLNYKFDDFWSVILYASYSYSTNSSDSFDIDNIQQFSIGLGFSISY